MKLSRQTWIRIGLWYMALTGALVSVWILLAPQNFYDDFPPGSGEWVSVLPPFNEHLERDFGAAGLGLAVLAAIAAIWLDRRLVQATAVALAVAGTPHLAYHATTTEHYSTSDNVQSLTGLALAVLVPLGVLWLATRKEASPWPESQASGARTPDSSPV